MAASDGGGAERAVGPVADPVADHDAGPERARRIPPPLRIPSNSRSVADRVPIVTYDDLLPWLERIEALESDVLFAGRPVAFERTSGSSGAAKLIPYSAHGLRDVQSAILPWLARLAATYGITGRVYFSISPATRTPECIGDIPVGLPDGAYLGALASEVLAEVTAVPFQVGAITDVEQWRAETLQCISPWQAISS